MDQFLAYLQHEFFLMTFGVFLYFLAMYAIAHEKGKADYRFWFQRNKVWILLTFIIGLMTIVWDDEVLGGWNDFVEHDITEVHKWMYFVAAPLITFMYRTFTSNFSVKT